MRNICCATCQDTGKVGFFFTKVCPDCHGEPFQYWLAKHPKPNINPSQLPPPPPPKVKIVEIHHYIHKD